MVHILKPSSLETSQETAERLRVTMKLLETWHILDEHYIGFTYFD